MSYRCFLLMESGQCIHSEKEIISLGGQLETWVLKGRPNNFPAICSQLHLYVNSVARIPIIY